jgi:hypothetical protein
VPAGAPPGPASNVTTSGSDGAGPTTPGEAGATELPIQLIERSHAVDRSLVGRSPLDALLGTTGRSFHVPVVLLLALGGYLTVQRRLGRGPLPMASAELPASVTVWPGQGDDDVRYFL